MSKLSRRSLLGGVAATAALGGAGLSLGGCASSAHLKIWKGPLAGTKSDPLTYALSLALLAPSSHNTQPWQLRRAVDQGIEVYADATRRLTHADFDDRQLWVSLGGFGEAFALAAAQAGRGAAFEAVDGAGFSGDRPALALRLKLGDKAASVSELGRWLTRRHSNKRTYETRAIASTTLAKIEKAVAPGGPISLAMVLDAGKRKTLATLCKQAMATEVESRARNTELSRWFRFSDELAKKRDGFGLPQSGVTGFSRWFAETFVIDHESICDPKSSFAKKGVEMAAEQAGSASAFVLILSKGNGRKEQLEAGRTFLRLQLAAEAEGIRSHPMSQALGGYPEQEPHVAALHKALAVPSSTHVQMLVRLGFAEPTEHAPRRPLSALWLEKAPT